MFTKSAFSLILNALFYYVLRITQRARRITAIYKLFPALLGFYTVLGVDAANVAAIRIMELT